ncbi:MAG: nucleoside-diphosphate kinase [Candidatus Omnitrophica bacterium]|nr:nucleoside-diphosphate kinase [Candidatus Omnitrophota bacterium]MCA9448288.1 nucleoside-diphosphate kinase [Candidatus Omnitrophota bacterium]
MADEKTLILVKPDGVARGLVGEVIGRFEKKGLKVAALKRLQLSKEKAETHYAVHKERPFFGELVEFITSGPIVAMVIEGPDAIGLCRKMMGATKPMEAEPGTIRGDFATAIQENIVHGSDGPDTAAYEIPIYFEESEII